jgi:hypothetical protein
MKLAKWRVMWAAFWRVFAATLLPLLAEAFVHWLDNVPGDPILKDVWWLIIAAPIVAAFVRRAIPQKVDSVGIGVVGVPPAKVVMRDDAKDIL